MKKADWAIHNRHAAPGGFGFSDINTNNPDCDDTQIVLSHSENIRTSSVEARISLASFHAKP